jgi:hypothetical protein
MWTTKLVVYNNRQALDDFKQQLNAKFKCSDSGPSWASVFTVTDKRGSSVSRTSTTCRSYWSDLTCKAVTLSGQDTTSCRIPACALYQ